MLRIVQAGMGGWGRDWAKSVVGPSDEVTTVAYVDADRETLELAREKLALPEEVCFDNLAEALHSSKADAVLVTANLPGHIPLTREALTAGKHVLLEKPFAPSLAEAEEVVALARERDLILMISQNYRFFPAVRAVRDFVNGGTLGKVGVVSVDFRKYANAAPKEGNRHYDLFHPLLADMSIHHFDLMRAVLGQEPVEVTCHAWNPEWSNFQSPAAAFATIVFDGGAVVSYRGSWVSPGPQTNWAGDWHMECAKGEIAWTSRDNTGASVDRVTVKALGKRATRLELPMDMKLDRAGTLHAFAQAVESRKQPESSGADNLGSVALMYSTIEAATTGHTVQLKPTKLK